MSSRTKLNVGFIKYLLNLKLLFNGKSKAAIALSCENVAVLMNNNNIINAYLLNILFYNGYCALL